MKIKKCLILIIFVIVFVSSSSLIPDDREIFSASVPPYVFFILDNSGSMDGEDFFVANVDDNPEKLANFQSYTTSTGKTYTYETEEQISDGYYYRCWECRWVRIRGRWRQVCQYWNDCWHEGEETGDHYATRIEALKRAVTELVDKTRDNIKIGLGHFFHSDTSSSGSAHGARLAFPIADYSSGDAARDAAFDALTDYINNSINANGYTPLAESMDTLYGYLAGDINSGDGNQWTDMYGNTRIPEGTTAPVQYTCQRTFAILVSDGAPTADDGNWGYPNPYTGLTMRNDPSTLPDVAAYLYNNPVSPATDGVVTYSVSMKLEGSGKTLMETVADVNHGHGEYYPGDDFDMLIENLLKVISSIEQRNYASTSYTSPKKIATAEDEFNVSYSGYFFSNSDTIPIWEGHLKCYDIVEDEDTYLLHECWDAAERMNTQGAGNRTISTIITDANNHTFTNVGFINSNRNILLTALNADDETQAGEIIDYILGTNRPDVEPADFYLLADIFHSTVTYMGSPLLWKAFYNSSECDLTDPTNDNDCYQYFYETNKDRQKVVFIGTNDGVVHTINASREGSDAGTEISGFIPDEVLPSLKNIAVTRYFTYTADGLMTVNDIYTEADKWKSVLIFGLREGGKAYYCRDVTDPLNQVHKWKFPAYIASGTVNAINGNVLTLGNTSGTFAVGQYVVNEKRTAKGTISALPDSDIQLTDVSGTFSVGDKVLVLPWYSKYLGYTWGKPKICRIKYRKASSGDPVEKWVTILTGGFGDGTDYEGKALFIVDAWTGELIWWLGYAGSASSSYDYYLTDDSNLNYPIPQSLTAVDKDNNTFVDTIYFGNLGGNMFKLDISDPQTSTWIPQILFRENDTDQPIYLSPSISYDQCYQLWVHFGTGNRIHPQDGPTGRFIAVRDDNNIPSGGCTRSDLQQLTWSDDDLFDTNITAANGWYFNFPDENEILFDPDPLVIPNNTMPYLYFNTYQPESVVVGGDPCGSGGNMTFYKISLHSCGDTVSGERESARISGGGLITGAKYLMYVGTGETGSLEIKRFETYTIPYPGGIIYWKETKR